MLNFHGHGTGKARELTMGREVEESVEREFEDRQRSSKQREGEWLRMVSGFGRKGGGGLK